MFFQDLQGSIINRRDSRSLPGNDQITLTGSLPKKVLYYLTDINGWTDAGPSGTLGVNNGPGNIIFNVPLPNTGAFSFQFQTPLVSKVGVNMAISVRGTNSYGLNVSAIRLYGD